ncbi:MULTISPECIES: hypothetical protein [unclassified Streptomyces]|uniref:hypothetical protein n=1 Tax=unclassified Streptomyces TaxID=2593676 RepID=UPI002E2D32E0|nr:hypothetical protein [Streptomyces sp. NBC_00223]
MKTPHVPATPAPADDSVTVEQAEAALVAHYPRLVRLAYLTLPAALGRHRRVLAAHRLAQRSLPRSARPSQAPGGAYGLLRQEVLRGALAYAGRGRVRRAAEDALPLPRVMGLRVHPTATGAEEPTPDRMPAAARAAYALLGVEGLGAREARAVLEAVGARGAAQAVQTAAARAEVQPPLTEGDFDPCTLKAEPTDLLRRRRRARVGLTAAVTVAVGTLLVSVGGGSGSPQSYAAAGTPGANPRTLDPTALVHPSADAWQTTTRLDFTAWPTRGDRTSDSALLGRALAVWANPGSSVDVSSTPGTPRTGPSQPPQLLFAGDVDNATVVIFYDGLRVIRYAQLRHGTGRAALDFSQVQNADLTTSAAVLVDRVDGNARFLTAPWVTDAQTVDLLRPDQDAQPLHRTADGVTDPVRTPGAGAAAGSCGTAWPALQLRPSAKLGGQRTFLLTDLGDLAPVHLTYTPPPPDAGAQSGPMEATGPQARASWAHSACRLGELRGQSVKSANNWEFARTSLPEDGGEASWTCDRADTWRGPGVATVQFVPPATKTGAPGTPAGQQADGNACSPYGPHVLAGVMWKSAAGHWYVLAAGDYGVSRITATDGVTASADAPFLSVPAPRGARPTLTGHLADGGTLSPLSGD